MLRRLFAQLGPDAGAAAIGWNFGALEPGAVRERKEIVARPDRSVHAGGIDVVSGCGSGGGGLQTLRFAAGVELNDRSEEKRQNDGVRTSHESILAPGRIPYARTSETHGFHTADAP